MNELLEKALESAFCQSVMEKINTTENLEPLKTAFGTAGITSFENIDSFLLAVATALDVSKDVSKDDSKVNIEKVCDDFNTYCNTHCLDELKIEDLDDVMSNLAEELDDRANRIEELEGKLEDIANLASY